MTNALADSFEICTTPLGYDREMLIERWDAEHVVDGRVDEADRDGFRGCPPSDELSFVFENSWGIVTWG